MKTETAAPVLNLARTSTALAAYDLAWTACDADPTEETLRSVDRAKGEVGRAFAFDTADRNDAADAAGYAAFDPERVRGLVAEYHADIAAGRKIAAAVVPSRTAGSWCKR